MIGFILVLGVSRLEMGPGGGFYFIYILLF